MGQESISSEFGFNTYYSSDGQSVAGIGDGTDNYSIAFAVINKVEDVCGIDSIKNVAGCRNKIRVVKRRG